MSGFRWSVFEDLYTSLLSLEPPEAKEDLSSQTKILMLMTLVVKAYSFCITHITFPFLC